MIFFGIQIGIRTKLYFFEKNSYKRLYISFSIILSNILKSDIGR